MIGRTEKRDCVRQARSHTFRLAAIVVFGALSATYASELSGTAQAPDRHALAFSEFKASHGDAAAELLLEPARKDDADAQYLLAEVLWHVAESSHPLDKATLNKAKIWAKRAAARHHAGGLLLYASMLRAGCDASPEDFAEAFSSIREAALLGLTEAQSEFAWLHIDYARPTLEARHFAQQSADQGDVLGQLAAGILEFLALSQSSGEIAGKADLAQAAAYLELAAGQGLIDAQRLYAEMLADGIGVDEDSVEALKWFMVSRALGWSDVDTAEDRLASEVAASDFEQARARANAWIKAALADPTRPIGPALVWCSQFRREDGACRTAAIWEDRHCLPLDLPMTPIEGFRQSKAYAACRAAIRDHASEC
jgi:TPR repeat protein